MNSKSTVVRRLMVDTGAESTWIDSKLLDAIGLERRKKDLSFQLANGQIITRSVGYAVLRVDKAETVDEVVFAEPGDLQLLGARALEGLNLQVDSRGKKLVAAGPIVTAAAVPPRFGELVQVPVRKPKAAAKSRASASATPAPGSQRKGTTTIVAPIKSDGLSSVLPALPVRHSVRTRSARKGERK